MAIMIMDLPSYKMVILHSYINLPEGKWIKRSSYFFFTWVIHGNESKPLAPYRKRVGQWMFIPQNRETIGFDPSP